MVNISGYRFMIFHSLVSLVTLPALVLTMIAVFMVRGGDFTPASYRAEVQEAITPAAWVFLAAGGFLVSNVALGAGATAERRRGREGGQDV